MSNYTAPTWANGSLPAINAAALQAISDALARAFLEGEIRLLPNSTTIAARVDIPDDGSATGTWPDRLAFYFNHATNGPTRTGYFNEYGELRARPGKTNTVSFRCQSHSAGTTGNILEVTNSTNATVYFAVGPNSPQLTLPNGIKVATGSGSPESAVTAPIGSTYHRTDGGAGTSFYVKETGSGSTGWVAK